MPPTPDKSQIEELQNSLYSRNAPPVKTRRKLRFSDPSSEVKTSWERKEEVSEAPKDLIKVTKHHMSFLSKLLIFSAIFCVVAVGLGAFIFFNGANLISTNNVDIVVNGPVSVNGGEPATFDIIVRNNNSIDLELADMTVNFPAGTTKSDDPTKELNNYTKMLGNIPAGSSTKATVSAIMFGEENLQKQIEVSVAFGVKGSTSTFTKKQYHAVLISSSPISVHVSSYKEVTSGQEFDINIDLKSNSQQVLKNILLKAEYPFGFDLISSSITPLSDKKTWKIGDIPPGGIKKLSLKGRITGENEETRAFQFMVGSASSMNQQAIGTEFMSTQHDITIQKPFISLKVAVNNDETEAPYAGTFGRPQRVEIGWFNNLPVAVSNLTITAELSGTAYDAFSVQPNNGNFESGRNTITWSQRTNSELSSIGPGESGSVYFSVTPRDKGNSVVNPNLVYKVNVSGKRPQETNVPENISAAATRESRITSSVSLTGRVVRTVGPFASANSGPVPPKVDKTTTYTVIWSIDNTSNAVTNARVVSTLPPYMKWLGSVSPSGENINYDENTGTISWNAGNVSTYTLKNSKRKEVAFQVSITPNLTELNQAPVIIGQATLSALDSYTGETITSSQGELTTRFSTDPQFREGDQSVVQ